MNISSLPIKKSALNPLWIIGIFFSFTETMLGYAVFNTQDGIQITLTIFVIIFPLFVATMFFVVLWNRPKHLYAPTDYQNDESFLESLRQTKTVDNLSKQIEETVNFSLNSRSVIEKLKSKRPEDVLQETANEIVKKIKNDNFITVDISKFESDYNDVLTWTYQSFKDFNDLTNAIYFKLRPAVKPYTYGEEWLLKNADNGLIYKNARMITGSASGEPVKDKRTLEEVGITPGTRLIVDKPN